MTIQDNTFTPIPGKGWLTFNKRTDAEHAIWQGSMALPNGHPAQIRATAITDGKHSRYECKIVEISEEAGQPWKTVAEFNLKPFGKKRSQDITIPTLGKAKVWRQLTRSKRNAIVVQVLDALLPDEEVM